MKISIIALLFFALNFTYSQDSLRSSVYKKKGFPSNSIRIVQPYDITYQLWEGFSLVRKANSGDPAALQELGLRYLTGRIFSPDTVKAFQLIKQAAERHYILANFNLGVFYHNGWGTDWNPYEAYQSFHYAAENDLKEGEYALGLYYTDNLAVQRDWQKAYMWIKKSADQGYAPALDLLPEIERFAFQGTQPDSTGKREDTTQSAMKQFEPVLLDFVPEQEEIVEENIPAVDIVKALGPKWQKKISDIPVVNDSVLFSMLSRHAEWGVPEEFTVIGRFYEKGLGVRKDSVQALLAYTRAVRLESRRAPMLLSRLLQHQQLLDRLLKKAQRGDVDAMYAVSALALTGVFPLQKKEDIVQYFQKAAKEKNIPALIELGNAYFSGQYIPQDKQKAIDVWETAVSLGNEEASIRIASAKIIGGFGSLPIDSAYSIIQKGNEEESLLAQLNLAYCYEKGIGGGKKLSEAVRLYRTAWQRGSNTAYSALRRLYDSIRPPGDEFKMTDRLD
jgi:hypothetical protein